MLTTKNSRILSDQYGYWSATSAETFAPISPEPTQKPLAPTATLVCPPARLTHRALQTLRQTRMQVRSGTRTRSQILPLHQPTRINPGDGLCSTGGSRHGRSVSRELSSSSRDSRPDLQHQSGTASSQGASIEKRRVHGKSHIPGCASNRSPPGGYPRRQHVGELTPSNACAQHSRRNQG